MYRERAFKAAFISCRSHAGAGEEDGDTVGSRVDLRPDRSNEIAGELSQRQLVVIFVADNGPPNTRSIDASRPCVHPARLARSSFYVSPHLAYTP